MTSSEKLLQATFNRLASRLSQKIIQFTNYIAANTIDAPEKIQKEWQIFQEEVREEADRLSNVVKSKSNNSQAGEDFDVSENIDPQERIDRLRAKISNLNRKLET